MSVPASAATPPVLQAPPGTVEMWIDVESDAARTGVTAISWRAGDGSWAETAVAKTVFGSTGIAQVSEGRHDVRFSVAGRITADVAISFADAAGAVLSEHRIREAQLDPKHAAAGWISWNDLPEGPIPNGGETAPAPGDSATEDASDPAAGPAAHGSDPKALGKTGVSASLLALVLGAAAVLTGTGLCLLRRPKRMAPALEGADKE